MNKYKKVLCIIIVSIFMCCIFILSIRMLFQEQVKNFIRQSVCSEVVRKEGELIEVIEELKNNESTNIIHRYKDIDNTISYKI